MGSKVLTRAMIKKKLKKKFKKEVEAQKAKQLREPKPVAISSKHAKSYKSLPPSYFQDPTSDPLYSFKDKIADWKFRQEAIAHYHKTANLQRENIEKEKHDYIMKKKYEELDEKTKREMKKL
jgi:hypothetical protein